MCDYVHVDFGVSKDCVNPDSYGQICVRCNCCGRFDKNSMWVNRYNMYWRELAEHIEKHSEDGFKSNLQQSNIASDVIHFGEKILECVSNLDFDNGNPETEKCWTLKSYCLEQEVERLTNILNSYALQYGTVADKQKVIDKAKAEVAREIFEEIDELLDFVGAMIGTKIIYCSKYAELRKKYTEGKGAKTKTVKKFVAPDMGVQLTIDDIGE